MEWTPLSPDEEVPPSSQLDGRVEKDAEEEPPPYPAHSPSPTPIQEQSSQEEVLALLCRLPWQSSPSPNGISYAIWKSTPSSAKILSLVFSTCLLNCKLPASWKRSNTILIHKRGEESDPENWRPISLQSTIYKGFAAVMAKRLATWALLEKKISSSQKGFLPFEGCMEHCFLMESVMADAKRRRKDVRVLWLDIKNAFGSVPTSSGP